MGCPAGSGSKPDGKVRHKAAAKARESPRRCRAGTCLGFPQEWPVRRGQAPRFRAPQTTLSQPLWFETPPWNDKARERPCPTGAPGGRDIQSPRRRVEPETPNTERVISRPPASGICQSPTTNLIAIGHGSTEFRPPRHGLTGRKFRHAGFRSLTVGVQDTGVLAIFRSFLHRTRPPRHASIRLAP